MSLFRPTALKYTRNLGVAAAICFGLLAIWTGSAMAKPRTSGDPALCQDQAFSQPFTADGDFNHYTLVDGSQFNGDTEGWDFNGGARVVDGTRPDGSSGGVLDLPSGATAISPPVCVTLQYPTARTWTQRVQGDGGGVRVSVYYAGIRKSLSSVGQFGTQEGVWQLSNPFHVRPELVTKEEGEREVRFVYSNRTKSSDFNVWGLFVDPRLR